MQLNQKDIKTTGYLCFVFSIPESAYRKKPRGGSEFFYKNENLLQLIKPRKSTFFILKNMIFWGVIVGVTYGQKIISVSKVAKN
jgi:hypothetical protein